MNDPFGIEKSAASRLTPLGGKFGKIPKKKVGSNGINNPALSGYLGATAGITAGSGGYYAANRKEFNANEKTMKSNTGQQAANTRKINRKLNEVSKSKSHLITDVGTRAAKYTNREAAKLIRPKRNRIAGAVGAAGGVTLGVSMGKEGKKGQLTTIDRQNKRLGKQEARMKELGISKRDPFNIEKAEKKKPSGATIAGAGAATSAVGFVAGGAPRKNVSLEGLNLTKKPDSAREFVRDKAKVAGRMSQGGILGFRSTVHQGGLYGFKQAATKDSWSGPAKDAKTAFKHGRNEGKIAPEVKVLRHMAGGRKAGNAALIGGAATAAYGAGKHKNEVKKSGPRKRSDAKNDAMIGAGTAGATALGAGSALLGSQKRAWKKVASDHIDAGGRIAPNTAGRRKTRSGPLGRPGMDPSVTDGAIARNPGLLKGAGIDGARKLGEHRGAAAQARHFSHVYGNTSKVTAAAAIPAAAVALAGHRDKKRTPIKKASRIMSDAEIKRRKKLQGQISVTTGTLGLAALGSRLGAKGPVALAGKVKNPKMAGKLKALNPEKMKDTSNALATTGAGIGGAGSYNFAAYTNAESRKRQTGMSTVKKNDGSSAFGIQH